LKRKRHVCKYVSFPLTALEEAKEAYIDFKKEQALLSESMDKRKSRKPPPYKSIKVYDTLRKKPC